MNLTRTLYYFCSWFFGTFYTLLSKSIRPAFCSIACASTLMYLWLKICFIKPKKRARITFCYFPFLLFRRKSLAVILSKKKDKNISNTTFEIFLKTFYVTLSTEDLFRNIFKLHPYLSRMNVIRLRSKTNWNHHILKKVESKK